MKGLILKELYFYKANAVIYLLLILCFFACVVGGGNPFMMFFAYLMTLMLPSSSFAYDEKYKWAQYSLSLPVTRKQTVDVKYLSMIIFYVGFCILSAVGVLINMAITGFKDMTGLKSLPLCIVLFGIFLGVLSAIMPFMFKLGAEKGRYVFMIFGGICGGGGAICFNLFADEDFIAGFMTNLSAHGGVILAVVFAVSMVIFACSHALSVHFYNKREM